MKQVNDRPRASAPLDVEIIIRFPPRAAQMPRPASSLSCFLTLAELLPAVEQLPAADKDELIRILAERLSEDADLSPRVPNKVYELPTPYGARRRRG